MPVQKSLLILFSLLSFRVFAQVYIREITKRECDSALSPAKEVNLESPKESLHARINVSDGGYFFQTEKEFRDFVFKNKMQYEPQKDTIALVCPDFLKYDVILIRTHSCKKPYNYKVREGKDKYVFEVYYKQDTIVQTVYIASFKYFLIPKGKSKLPEVSVYETWKNCD